MAQLVVRRLEESVKRGLSRRARRHGRSMEDEIRHILRQAAAEESRTTGLGTRIASRFRGTGLRDELPEVRGTAVRPAEFDE
jgi:plasmid stability protein